MPWSDTPFKKKGGSIRQPWAPTSSACRVSSSVSGSAVQLVDTRIRSAGTPLAISASMASRRSATENEGPSPVVPKGVTPPAPSCRSALTCAAKRVWSMFRSASRGVSSAGQMPRKAAFVAVVEEEVTSGSPRTTAVRAVAIRAHGGVHFQCGGSGGVPPRWGRAV